MKEYYNLSCEQATLGSCIIDNDAFITTVETVPPTSFYKKEHGIIYQAMLEMLKDNIGVDLVTITVKLNDKNLLEAVGGVTYLTNLINAVPTSKNINHYNQVIVATALRRKQRTLLSDVESGKIDIEAAMTALEKIPVAGVSEETFQAVLESAFTRSLKGTDFKFKIGALNKYLGGLDKGELLTIGGYTSQAKSGLGVQMAINQAVKGRRVLFLSTEMLVPEVGRRILGNQCGINITNMRRGLMTPDETAYAKETTKIIGQDWKINIKKIYSIDDVFKYVRKYKPEILFLDYIQNLSGESDYKTITQNMKLLQSITFQNEISTVCISQLNRNKEEIREPRLTDLRDSGRLEECSNMVIFLYWKERLQLKNKQRMGGEPPEQIEIIVGKNRDGACGRFMINFYPEYARFEDQAFEEYDNYKE